MIKRYLLLTIITACGRKTTAPPHDDAQARVLNVGSASSSNSSAPPRVLNPESGDPPASMVVVGGDARFYIDRTEVTVGDYTECVDAKVCAPPQLARWNTWSKKRAVTFVSPEQAWDYCSYRGKRLPTNEEWLRAALGADGRPYPWGKDKPSCEFAVIGTCAHDVGDVGAAKKDVSPVGAFDMAGNASELANFDLTNQRAALHADVLGGSVSTAPDLLAHEMQQGADSAVASEFVGFRCAKTPH